jgi:hypothetical protein
MNKFHIILAPIFLIKNLMSLTFLISKWVYIYIYKLLPLLYLIMSHMLLFVSQVRDDQLKEVSVPVFDTHVYLAPSLLLINSFSTKREIPDTRDQNRALGSCPAALINLSLCINTYHMDEVMQEDHTLSILFISQFLSLFIHLS